jgi:hypothetical protein
MTAELMEPIAPGQTYILTGAHLATEGRKASTATALHTDDGALVARAEHVWIAVDPHAFG